jgi:hypothetical protein
MTSVLSNRKIVEELVHTVSTRVNWGRHLNRKCGIEDGLRQLNSRDTRATVSCCSVVVGLETGESLGITRCYTSIYQHSPDFTVSRPCLLAVLTHKRRVMIAMLYE